MFTLIKFELKKMMSGRIFWILLLVFAAFVALNFITTTFGYTIYDTNLNKLTGLSAIRYDRDQQNQYAGKYSDEESVEIEKKAYEVFDKPEWQIGENENPTNPSRLTDETYWKYARPYEAVWYGTIRQNSFDDIIIPTLKSGDLTNLYYSSMLRFAQSNINMFPSPGEDTLEAQRLLSMYEKVEQPFTIEFTTGMKALVNSLVSILLFPGIAILIICLSPIFSKEYSTKSAPSFYFFY
ncbi:hypothetical protein FACS189425_11160 [Clostridia bacterium]|nr:hypothetical protein FACS189425_11160 [Clostridia bacterium]